MDRQNRPNNRLNRMINLTKREKILLRIFIVFVSVIAVYFAIIKPILSLKENTETQYKDNITKLSKLEAIYDQYKEIRQKKNQYEQMLQQSGGITSLIKEHAKSADIVKNITYTRENPGSVQNKYKKNSTEVKFEGVGIKSVMNFIYKIENSNRLLKISYLRIHQALKGKDMYDVIIKIDSLSNQ